MSNDMGKMPYFETFWTFYLPSVLVGSGEVNITKETFGSLSAVTPPAPDLLQEESESFMTRTSTGMERAKFGGRSTPAYLTR